MFKKMAETKQSNQQGQKWTIFALNAEITRTGFGHIGKGSAKFPQIHLSTAVLKNNVTKAKKSV